MTCIPIFCYERHVRLNHYEEAAWVVEDAVVAAVGAVAPEAEAAVDGAAAEAVLFP